MPADSQSKLSPPSQPYHYLVGVIAGVISFSGLSLVFSRIGVEPMETIIFASLSAFTVGVFVCRERALVYESSLAEFKHAEELGEEAARIDELYSNSVACLVTFDAGSLIVDRVSSGFFELLGVSADRNLSGARLDEVLGGDSTHLMNVVSRIKDGTISVREEIQCQLSDGKPVSLLVSGRYMPRLNLLEAAFYRLPCKTTDLADYERVTEDLERFKKGIVRRESRVLELKGEVNQLLQASGQSVRYQVDAMTDDSRFVKKTIRMNKAAKHG